MNDDHRSFSDREISTFVFFNVKINLIQNIDPLHVVSKSLISNIQTRQTQDHELHHLSAGTRGPEDQKTRGPEDQRTRRPEDQRTRGPEDQKTRGPASTAGLHSSPRTGTSQDQVCSFNNQETHS
ncbi:Hypothetical predicted protein [Xyrichtys novacula]|uniref:Uncharacterized protein n=1 Tax=Xyrichtys novacula TaxID=13765 RepID=A0AAV1FPP0_XYRNO|nr:Hypothetical predicted protein [Xyrichtys novacula]